MTNSILIPTAEQIQELRKIFFEKLDNEGAPATCVGKIYSRKIVHIMKTAVAFFVNSLLYFQRKCLQNNRVFLLISTKSY